jgi:hypothetical protein
MRSEYSIYRYYLLPVSFISPTLLCSRTRQNPLITTVPRRGDRKSLHVLGASPYLRGVLAGPAGLLGGGVRLRSMALLASMVCSRRLHLQ